MIKCTCGNPKMGFDCTCNWSNMHPGNKHYSCEYCGVYDASEPKCQSCEERED